MKEILIFDREFVKIFVHEEWLKIEENGLSFLRETTPKIVSLTLNAWHLRGLGSRDPIATDMNI